MKFERLRKKALGYSKERAFMRHGFLLFKVDTKLFHVYYDSVSSNKTSRYTKK